MGGRGCAEWKGVKGGKWENCNSIINKIYIVFKRRGVKKIEKENNTAVNIGVHRSF